jgi:hypothetical protein
LMDACEVQWDRLQPGRRHFEHRRFCGATADACPAKAGPTPEITASLDGCMRCSSGTGFSREAARLNTVDFVV